MHFKLGGILEKKLQCLKLVADECITRASGLPSSVHGGFRRGGRLHGRRLPRPQTGQAQLQPGSSGQNELQAIRSECQQLQGSRYSQGFTYEI